MSGPREKMSVLAVTPFILLFGVLSIVYLLAPLYAPAMAATLEPARFSWLVEGYPQSILSPASLDTLETTGDALIIGGVCALLGLFPLVFMSFATLVWLPAMALWGELEDQVASGWVGFFKTASSALLPFLVSLAFAFVLDGTVRGAIAYGACTLFLPQVVCVLLEMTVSELSGGSPSWLGLIGHWFVAIPLCMPSYLAIFVLEPSRVWWAVEHIAMLVEVAVLWRALGFTHRARSSAAAS